ncbi:DUF560 domain-containing protein [Salmonella enterica subsp. enterica serovar Teshie]|nr:DUF560 domain-containing protein [Salmonella enterica subsp. enterica serovar Teshie]
MIFTLKSMIKHKKRLNISDLLLLLLLFSAPSYPKTSIDSILAIYLINNDARAIEKVLHECNCAEHIAPPLLDWVNAILMRQTKNYSGSIHLYRKIISEHPDWYSARLQLATVLYMNKDILSAEEQLRKLRSDKVYDDEAYLIDRLIKKIQNSDAWSFSGGFTYLNERNINNSPKSHHTIGGWRPEKAQSGKGILYWGEAEKTIALPDNFFTIARFSISGKTYWDNHSYDELNGSISAGAGFRNINTNIKILPFYDKSYFGGGNNTYKSGLKPYSETSGVKLETRFQLSPAWLLHSDFSWGKNIYKKRNYLDGLTYRLDETLFYAPSSRQYLFSGVSHRIITANNKDNAFNDTTLRVGWMYEWNGGISTILQSSYGYRSYDSADFWGIRRINHEYDTSVTIWHRDIYIWGITPKVTWSYKRVDSNHPFYDIERHRIFWSFSKYF